MKIAIVPRIDENRSLLAEFTQRARCQNDFASTLHRQIVLRGFMIQFDVGCHRYGLAYSSLLTFPSERLSLIHRVGIMNANIPS